VIARGWESAFFLSSEEEVGSMGGVFDPQHEQARKRATVPDIVNVNALERAHDHYEDKTDGASLPCDRTVEAAYRRGCHQAVVTAAGLVGKATGLPEAREVLGRLTGVLGKMRVDKRQYPAYLAEAAGRAVRESPSHVTAVDGGAVLER
jgi:hypothetical protein